MRSAIDEMRAMSASIVLAGLLAGSSHEDKGGGAFAHQPDYHRDMAREAVRFADALLDALQE